MNQVLLIEDDKNIIELLDIHLRYLPCNVIKAFTGGRRFGIHKRKKFRSYRSRPYVARH